MASAAPLDDHISCAVCFEVYRDPHALKCLHTFCLQCIQQLEQRRIVECPECREITNIGEIKRDFKTQSLIDVLSKQTPAPKSHGTVAICEMCDDKSAQVKSKCDDCDQLMCTRCELTHSKMKMARNHKVQPIESIITSLKSKVKRSIESLENQQLNAVQKIRDIDTNISDIKECEKQQLQVVKECEEDCLKKLRDKIDVVKEDILKLNSEAVGHLEKEKKDTLTIKKGAGDKIGFLEGLMQESDLATLSDTVDNMDLLSNEDHTGQIHGKYVQSPLRLTRRELKLELGLKINLRDNESTVALQNVFRNTYRKSKSVAVNGLPYRLCVINNCLWIAQAQNIAVYDKDSEAIKEIGHKDIKNVYGMAVVNTGDIILACSGLHQIDKNGEYKRKITDGSFAHVTAYKGKIYALECKLHKVCIFEAQQGEWVQVDSFDLPYKNGQVVDAIAVTQDCIYVSSYNNHCIYQCTANGKYVKTLGKTGSYKTKDPRLCQVDDSGNMLVADTANDCLMVCDSQGVWNKINLPGDIKLPMDAVLDQDGNLYVITFTPYQLIKYSQIS